ncbi:hypothetical protein COV56_00575 [Candidatus Kuenenbacteria bacterium CG11_big_fil_rev_8_21_14_0_20_37_9]|nr:MAG: hypothetical protein COV56_00575 [Candidatus Kuenenbacteria bacterium CG11_big_fil_rev_8_21_14_0_20_37_9]
MTKEKWLDMIDMVEDKFGIDKEYKEIISPNIPGEKHIIEFSGPIGRMKIEFIEKPRVLDEKTFYSNRVGSHVNVEKVYDKKDKVCYFNAYKWDEASEGWEQINADFFQ